MKWGIRRYQPYPKGYRGDGQFFGVRKEPYKTIPLTSKNPIINPSGMRETRKHKRLLNGSLTNRERKTLIKKGSMSDISKYQVGLNRKPFTKKELDTIKKRMVDKGSFKDVVKFQYIYSKMDTKDLNQAYKRLSDEAKKAGIDKYQKAVGKLADDMTNKKIDYRTYIQNRENLVPPKILKKLGLSGESDMSKEALSRKALEEYMKYTGRWKSK